jgi:predicted DsbA family dithiol-disulfide isomerase
MEGIRLETLFAPMGVDIQAKSRELQQVAAAEGLPFGARTMTFNSRRAQELGKWAEALGRGEAYHRAAFHAYFAEGENIAETDVLLAICRRAGLDEDAARDALEVRPHREDVDQDWKMARSRGITAVPTLSADDAKLVGAQSYEAMVRFVTAARR